MGVPLDDVIELGTVRKSLEALASSLATRASTDGDLAILAAVIAEDEAALADGAPTLLHVELNHRFHEVIWRAARNRRLTAYLTDLRDKDLEER